MRAIYLKMLQMRHYIACFWQHIISIVVVFTVMVAAFYSILVVADATQRVRLAEQVSNQAKAEREAVLKVLSGDLVMLDEEGAQRARVVWEPMTAQKPLIGE